MSKRSAQWQGGEERYGGPSQPEDMADKPTYATAAQLAKRKIAQAKGSRRPRSESPLTSTGSIFDQATQNGLIGHNNVMVNPSTTFNATPNFTFGGANANGSTQSFGSGGGSFTFGGQSGQQTQQSTPNTNTSFTFGAATASNPSFGQTPTQPSNGFGSGISFGQQNGDTNKGLFGETTPKPTTNSVFGEQTPKPSNPFGDSSKPFTGIFGNTNGNGTTSGFLFGQKPADSQTTTSTFGGFSTTQTAPEKPANDGWSSFLNQKPAETSKPAANGFTPSTTSIFSQPNGNTSQTNGVFAGFGQAQKTPNFKFTAQPEDNDASMMSPESTPQKQNTGIFGGLDGAVKEPTQVAEAPISQDGKGRSLFDRISKDPPKESTSTKFGGSLQPAAPATNLFSQASTTTSTTGPVQTLSPPTEAIQSAMPAAQSTMDKTKPEHFISIRELNEALLQHLKSQDLNKDLSSIFQYYQQEVGKLQNGNTAALSDTYTPSAPPTKPTSSDFGNNTLEASTASQALASSLSGAIWTAAPAIDPQPAYPSLPNTASATSKLFQAALEKPSLATTSSASLFAPAATTNGFTSFGKSLFDSKQVNSSATTSSGFKPADAASSTSSLFTPKPADTPATPSLFAPKPAEVTTKSSGFTPSVAPSTGGSSFLSSFGQQAAQNAEKEKKRRRDEEYDSEEENEKDWEKRDAEEQAAKRAKIEEAAKASSGFKFVPTSTTSSLFGKPAATESSTTNSNAVQAEDHTWKQGTPIKFGAAGAAPSTTPAAAPKFNLFGATTPATSLFANTPKPAATMSFGQSSSTPAPTVTNEAESADHGEDGDAAPPEPQLDDLAVLLQSEKDESDVLYFVEKSKSRKLEARAAEGGSEKLTWIDKGHGPIWILRNKTTGKARVLQKIKDSGRTAMNFSILAGNESLYKHEGMNGKAIMATFIDHLGKDTSKPSQWAIIVGKKEDAAEIAKILREEQKKA